MKKEFSIKRIHEIIDYESDDSNFKIPFKAITKKYGREFVAVIQAMWEANDGVQTEGEFCKMNADMPKGFFENVIKNKKTNTR